MPIGITFNRPSDISNIPIGDSDTEFRWVEPDTLQLYVNNVLRQSWTTEVAPPVSTGVPIGILAGITYPD